MVIARTRTTQEKNITADMRNEITKLAFKFFQERGYKHGHDFDDWLKAERIVKSKYGIR